MKRLPPALLLAIPFVVGLVPHATETSPPIEVTLSRFAFSP